MTAPLITMLSGTVTEGRPALAAVFKALPDGKHTVRIAPATSALPEIEEVVEWYSGLDELQMNDPALLHLLNPRSATLATALLRYADEVSELHRLRAGAKLKVQIEQDKMLAEAKAAWAPEGKGRFQVATAQIDIRVALAPLLVKEVDAEHTHRAAQLLLGGYKDVLQRMNQQISLLRIFCEAERQMGRNIA